ncbi:uncharacterized protein LOC128964108 [Oppia nitens]|uniref:uncharacterized protein LOC128964108 n=1 Tax=Oppia nitens TaxID=1686743 RepID=UPI0023DAD2FD|nr:uncharacterized protein LOC128964108 [Oppia nitens]
MDSKDRTLKNQEYYDRLQSLLMTNAIIRPNKRQSVNCLTQQQMPTTDGQQNDRQLSRCDVWRLERLESLSSISANDCLKLMDNEDKDIDQTMDTFKQIDFILHTINSFKVNDISQQDFRQFSHIDIDDNQNKNNQQLIQNLKKEIDEKEKILALFEVTLLEDPSMDDLVSQTVTLKSQIQGVERQIKQIHEELVGNELTESAVNTQIQTIERQLFPLMTANK